MLNYYLLLVLVVMNLCVLDLLRLNLFEIVVLVDHLNLEKLNCYLLLVLMIMNFHVLVKLHLFLFEIEGQVHHLNPEMLNFLFPLVLLLNYLCVFEMPHLFLIGMIEVRSLPFLLMFLLRYRIPLVSLNLILNLLIPLYYYFNYYSLFGYKYNLS